MVHLTDTQLWRLRKRIVQRVYRLFSGGTQYGVDLHTLYVVYPGWHAVYARVSAECTRRGL